MHAIQWFRRRPQDLDSSLGSLLEVFPQYRGEAPSCTGSAVNALHVVLLSSPLDGEVMPRVRVSFFFGGGSSTILYPCVVYGRLRHEMIPIKCKEQDKQKRAYNKQYKTE